MAGKGTPWKNPAFDLQRRGATASVWAPVMTTSFSFLGLAALFLLAPVGLMSLLFIPSPKLFSILFEFIFQLLVLNVA